MAARDSSSEAISVSPRYPCATFFIDESATKESAGRFFVVGALKSRRPGQLLRDVQAIRDSHGFADEFKFSRITRGKLPIYYQIIDALEASDVHLGACVVNRSLAGDPFASEDPEWIVHARITAKLLTGMMNRRELSAALLDSRSTPAGESFGDTVRQMVNTRLKGLGLVSAVCVDSECSDGVQLADLIAGSIAHRRRPSLSGAEPATNSHKAKVAARLAATFGVGDLSSDIRVERLNIMTHGNGGEGPSGRSAKSEPGALRVVPHTWRVKPA